MLLIRKKPQCRQSDSAPDREQTFSIGKNEKSAGAIPDNQRLGSGGAHSSFAGIGSEAGRTSLSVGSQSGSHLVMRSLFSGFCYKMGSSLIVKIHQLKSLSSGEAFKLVGEKGLGHILRPRTFLTATKLQSEKLPCDESQARLTFMGMKVQT